MTSCSTRIASSEDFPAIAALIEKLNRDPQTQCIHSGTGESIESMIAEVQKWHESGEIIFVVAFDNDQIIGTMGCEFENDGQRGWLRGPFSKIPFGKITSQMYDQLRAAIPPEICRLDSFLNIDNKAGQAFYEQLGYELKGRSHVYIAEPPGETRKSNLSMASHAYLCTKLNSLVLPLCTILFSQRPTTMESRSLNSWMMITGSGCMFRMVRY